MRSPSITTATLISLKHRCLPSAPSALPIRSLLRLERCNSKLDQGMKCLALASKRHPLKARGFARMAQATRSTQARPILFMERTATIRSPLFICTTSKRTLLLRAHTALFRRFLPNTPLPMRANQRDSVLSRQRTAMQNRRLNKPHAQERAMPPAPGRDRTPGIPQASPQSSARKLHRNPTTTRTTLLQVDATKHPTHKPLHLRISSHSLPPRSTHANALKHGHA